MIELTESIQKALDAQQGEPVRLIDPRTRRVYVLLPAEVFERVRALLDDGLDSRQVGILVEQTMSEYDAEDPLLDSYQKYRAEATSGRTAGTREAGTDLPNKMPANVNRPRGKVRNAQQ
jgi:hypothetical protein